MTSPSLPFISDFLDPGSRLCVAVSGGADSVALLCALHRSNLLRRGSLAVGLSVVHVHHGLRGDEAEEDANFVGGLCASLDIPLQIHRVNVMTHRQATGETMEEAARSLRYQVFQSILSSGGVDCLLTAHTLDDQAETVLMKLLRGAWTEGLGGIHPVLRPIGEPRKLIVRPLLGTSRAQVVAYLRQIDQTWREDTSNADPTHTRNRIRHQILPLLRVENPSLDQTLANLSELAREEEDRWRHALGRLLPQLLLPGRPVRGGGRAVPANAGTTAVSIEIERLRELDDATRRRVLRAAARSLGSATLGIEVRLSFDETFRLLALCGFRQISTVSSRPGTVLQLSHHVAARISARDLTLSLVIPAKYQEINSSMNADDNRNESSGPGVESDE